MPRVVNLRNIPNEVYRRLKVRAAKEGLTIPALLRREFCKVAEALTQDESSRRLRAASRSKLHLPREPVGRQRTLRP
jgi:plasmid stability protein